MPTRKRDPTVGSELEGIGQQILEHLLEPFDVGAHAARKFRVKFDVECQVLRFGHVPKAALHRLAQSCKRHLFRFDGDGAGFDFGKVENVADEIQEIGAGRMNIFRELHLLRLQVSFRIVRQSAAPGSGCC